MEIFQALSFLRVCFLDAVPNLVDCQRDGAFELCAHSTQLVVYLELLADDIASHTAQQQSEKNSS